MEGGVLHSENDISAEEVALIDLLLKVGIVVIQIGLYFWMHQYRASFLRVTLVLLFFFPPVSFLHNMRKGDPKAPSTAPVSTNGTALMTEGTTLMTEEAAIEQRRRANEGGFPVLFSLWFVFTVFLVRFSYLASRKVIDGYTPRKVYGFFYWVHRITSMGALACFILINIVILQIDPSDPTAYDDVWTLLLRLMGSLLYIGVLSRDFAQVMSEYLSNRLGFRLSLPQDPKDHSSSLSSSSLSLSSSHSSRSLFPSRSLDPRLCAICGLPLQGERERERERESDGEIKGVTRLECDHLFHEFCIKGWTIIGKKDTCPYCCERVKSPKWKKMFDANVSYAVLLDIVRYFVVWNPAILFYVFFISRAHNYMHAGHKLQ